MREEQLSSRYKYAESVVVVSANFEFDNGRTRI